MICLYRINLKSSVKSDNEDRISSIELFPNELLIEIFEYISAYNLYNTFFGLNSRLNSIINSLQNLYLIHQEDWDGKERFIPFFASRITTLIIKHDELIDFSYYSNIRSLKLCMPTVNQCNTIQPHLLPNLKNLYISNFYYSDNSEQLCHLLFSSSFPYLHTCQIDRISMSNFHSFSSLSIRQLTISPCTWKSNLFKQIFDACPNLNYLRIIRLRNISFEIVSDFIYPHTSFRRLDIQFYSIEEGWFNQVDWILSMMPNLENFKLRIDQNETNMKFPFDLFAQLIIQRVPYLINFKAKIPLKKLLATDLEEIKRLHPLFIYVQFQEYISRDLNNYLIISSEKCLTFKL